MRQIIALLTAILFSTQALATSVIINSFGSFGANPANFPATITYKTALIDTVDKGFPSSTSYTHAGVDISGVTCANGQTKMLLVGFSIGNLGSGASNSFGVFVNSNLATKVQVAGTDSYAGLYQYTLAAETSVDLILAWTSFSAVSHAVTYVYVACVTSVTPLDSGNATTTDVISNIEIQDGGLSVAIYANDENAPAGTSGVSVIWNGGNSFTKDNETETENDMVSAAFSMLTTENATDFDATKSASVGPSGDNALVMASWR